MEMRRKERELPREQATEILKNGEYGFLSTVGQDGEPYGVPLSYVYDEKSDAVYFHCAYQGRKLDNIADCPKVCFAVVGKTEVQPEKLTTKYESAIVFGSAAVLQGEEKREALIRLCEKYTSRCMDIAYRGIEKSFERTCMVKIRITQLSGKAKR